MTSEGDGIIVSGLCLECESNHQFKDRSLLSRGLKIPS